MMLNQTTGYDFLLELILMKLKVWDKWMSISIPPYVEVVFSFSHHRSVEL